MTNSINTNHQLNYTPYTPPLYGISLTSEKAKTRLPTPQAEAEGRLKDNSNRRFQSSLSLVCKGELLEGLTVASINCGGFTIPKQLEVSMWQEDLILLQEVKSGIYPPRGFTGLFNSRHGTFQGGGTGIMLRYGTPSD
eukprot:Tbor_TRINITY_DN5989_c0_g1::TRINITY_DN5989_c0_g1_i2::g.19119::m.19119